MNKLKLTMLALTAVALMGFQASASAEALASWNDGPAKKAILEFVKATTEKSSPKFVPEDERVATFDQDGTLWVEHPAYGQLMYCLDRVPALVAQKPELRNVEPFKTVLSGDREAIGKLPVAELEKIAVATLTGMTTDEFNAEVTKWLSTAKDPRWKRPYTDLTYLPMTELLSFLREHGYKTYIVTGGGQDFVRVYSQKVYGLPPEQVVGSAVDVTYGYAKDGTPQLTKEPKLLLNNNYGGKPEGIHLMIGRQPQAAFGNSTGDQQMLEYAGASAGAHLSCSFCTTMQPASMRTDRRPACQTRRSARSRRNCTTKRSRKAGPSSA